MSVKEVVFLKRKITIKIEPMESDKNDYDDVGTHEIIYEDIDISSLQLTHQADDVAWNHLGLAYTGRPDLYPAGEVTLKFKCNRGYNYAIERD